MRSSVVHVRCSVLLLVVLCRCLHVAAYEDVRTDGDVARLQELGLCLIQDGTGLFGVVDGDGRRAAQGVVDGVDPASEPRLRLMKGTITSTPVHLEIQGHAQQQAGLFGSFRTRRRRR